MSKVIVLGSINQDVVVTCERAPQLGETVHGNSVAYFPGGKGGNQAVAAARQGADVAFIGAVGSEAAGEAMLANFDAHGIDRSRVGVSSEPTGTATITVDAAGANAIVVVAGANGQVEAPSLADFGEGDVLVAQLEIPWQTVAAGLAEAKSRSMTTVLNAAPAADVRELLADVDVLVVNETEIQLSIDGDFSGRAELIARAGELAEGFGCAVVVTLGGQGCVARGGRRLGAGQVVDVPAHSVDVVDTTGAGDTFVGALAACLAEGRGLAEAIAVATAAGSLSTTKLGAQSGMPTSDEVRAFMDGRP
ncbi:MAG: ribokinase [Actinomycetaceae bacterium]|nr:ribokinase [Actinomycetaceae bacterium]